MATSAEILEVRNNTNTTTSDYSDAVIEQLIDDTSVECASATIWKWELAKLGKAAAQAVKKSSGGVESHEFNSIKDQMGYYRDMLKFWTQECKDSQGNSSGLFKATQPSVGGVVTEDQLSGNT